MKELVDLFRLPQSAQPMFAMIAQGRACGHGITSELLDCLGQQDLTTVPHGEQPGQAVQGRGQVVAMAIWLGLAGVQGHAHAERLSRRPGFGQDGLLPGQRSRKGSGRCWEGGLQGITDRLEVHTSMSPDDLAEHVDMPRDGLRHGRAVVLPKRGAAFDIGEEKRHRPTWQVNHRHPQEGDSPGQLLTIPTTVHP